jgi:hypothetical protein
MESASASRRSVSRDASGCGAFPSTTTVITGTNSRCGGTEMGAAVCRGISADMFQTLFALV